MLLYSIYSELTFDLTPGDPASETSVLSPPVHLKYRPLVPTSIPQFPVSEMAQVTEPVTNKVLVKASLESAQRGVCPGKQRASVVSVAVSRRLVYSLGDGEGCFSPQQQHMLSAT
jgi:hypothetical protein